MSDAIRLNALVSSAVPPPRQMLPPPSLTRVARAIDGTETARPATPKAAPPMRIAQADVRGIRIGERAPDTAIQTTPIHGKPAGDVALINVSADEAQLAVQESLRAVSLLQGQSAVASRNQYAPSQVFKDQLGLTHVRMNRVIDGIPVFGEQIISHLDKKGQVSALTGDTSTSIPGLSTKPTRSADEAAAIALKAFGDTPEETTKPELVIIKADDGVYHLTYHVIVTKLDQPREPRKESYFIDAQSGSIVINYNEIHGFVPEWRWPWDPKPQQPAPQPSPDNHTDSVVPAGTGNSLYLGTVPLTTTRTFSGFTLLDPSHNNTETRDAQNRSSPPIFGDGFQRASVITDNNNAWGEATDDPRARAGIDAQYISVKYLEYLKDMYNRDGINGRGMVSHSLVHVNSNLVNAYWDGNKMNYGDGDGVNAGPLVDKDVASHEPTHGVTQSTSNLTYRGESGALNEAMSDIMGSAGFSWWLRGKKDNGIHTDFLIGEDCWTPGVAGDALRYMDHPTQDRRAGSDMYSRDHYSDRYTGDKDNGGVHTNSGIANNAFFLLAAGGTNDTSKVAVANGIGVEKAVRIFARANMVYFTPSTTFAQAREFTIKAARDLYGDGAEAERVGQAWSAVGVS